jgi:hypothetical protein
MRRADVFIRQGWWHRSLGLAWCGGSPRRIVRRGAGLQLAARTQDPHAGHNIHIPRAALGLGLCPRGFIHMATELKRRHHEYLALRDERLF